MRKFTCSFLSMNFCTLTKPSALSPEILLNDFPEIDLKPKIDVYEGDLKGVISDLLKKKYLAVCQKSLQEINNQTTFNGVNYGDGFGMFVTIPTRPNARVPYLYVHYFLDSGSPFTTLTH